MRIAENRRLHTAFLIIIGATVLSFFIHSLMPPSVSQSESDGVADILAQIIPTDTTLGSFIVANVRKIAHFCEYGLLGLEMALYVTLFRRKRLACALRSIAFAGAVAFVDESLQIVSGRGPSISDVWLDVFGFTTVSAIVYVSVFSINKILLLFNKHVSERRSDVNGKNN